MRPLISVIVPIYGVDKYVGCCIESILYQTYRNIEIILVDDGSTDRCGELCDLYAKKDSRIKVIHKSNGGLVSARKEGLRQSNGRYVSYVDGDDWICSDFIENLYEKAASVDADIVCAGFMRDLFTKSEHFKDEVRPGIYEGDKLEDIWCKMISQGESRGPGITTYLWNKLFKREILLRVQLSVDNRISIGEDAAVTYPSIYKSNRIVICDNCFYHYRQREDSMLKQNLTYSEDAIRLTYLYDYLSKWAMQTINRHGIQSQVDDYILSTAIIRSGGRLPQKDYSVFGKEYYGSNIVVYSAGTFGQQLVNRVKEAKNCNLVAWIDDDYWEYRRCCLDVDPIESINEIPYDYILIAKTDQKAIEKINDILQDYGVCKNKILSVSMSGDKESLIRSFLDIKALKLIDSKLKEKGTSHV